uniref:Uncharacterized protein n=1 Tax=Oryza punctata TaxID=4537 RepID=A0A0E0KV37_ORYPU
MEIDQPNSTHLPQQIWRTILLAITWNIWKCRNNKAFNNIDESDHCLRQRCIDDLLLWSHGCPLRFKPHLSSEVVTAGQQGAAAVEGRRLARPGPQPDVLVSRWQLGSDTSIGADDLVLANLHPRTSSSGRHGGVG